MRVVLTIPGMDAVDARRELPYKDAGGQPLLMDLYSPPGPPRPRPAVVLIHGGPVPRLGARRMGVFTSYGELLAASGLVAVAFDHRFFAPQRLPDAARDVEDLVAHVRANAVPLGVDPDQMALWAFSGGGSLLAAPLRDRPAWLRAVVAYYAVLDLRQPPPGEAIGEEEGRTFSPVCSLAAASPALPPILVARAGLDHPWLNGGLDRFVQAAVASGATLDLLTHPGGRHGFDVLDDDLRSRQIIRRTLGFLREQLES